MAKANNGFERMAAEAAERLDRARAAGEQLELLPAEPRQAVQAVADDRQPGQRGKGKATSQLRRWLAQAGYRQPEEVLAEMAGLAGGGDAFLVAMARTEQVVAWAGAHLTPKGKIDLFLQLYSAQLRAADALMPYGLAKVTPEQAAAPQVYLLPVGQPGDGARLIEGQARSSGAGDLAPPPMPWEIEQDQQVVEQTPEPSERPQSDGLAK